eukprot:TRINITY_DN102684_c0_g1_i1.p1 TRINITY_DN102684_c0_g1~~TRINITY_DN102684_c0_g1_i1.p1  ORF type:complete len:648 (-),score=128.96 TRINITY_DN102684_c0_g1_i1:370-2313(-)
MHTNLAGPSAADLASSAAAPPRRYLRRQSTEQVVAQKLRDNFKGAQWDHTAIYVRKVNGKTLWERLVEDTHNSRHFPEAAPAFGRDYYLALKQAYAPSGDPDRLLATLNPQPRLVVRPTLLAAMTAATKANPDRAPAVTFLQQVNGPLNKTEVVGIYRWVLTLNPRNTKMLPDLVEVIRCVAALGLHTMFEDLWEVVRPFLDSAMERYYVQARSQGMSLSRFCAAYTKLLGIFIPMECASRVLAHGHDDDWSDRDGDVAKLNESKVGSAMFVFAAQQIAAAQVEGVLKTKALSLLSDKITPGTIRELKAQMTESCGALANIAHLVPKRKVSFNYGTAVLSREVPNLTAHIDLVVDAMKKSVAVANGHLEQVFCEELLEAIHSKGQGIEPSEICESRSARAILNQAAKDADATSGDVVATVVKTKAPSLLLLDGSFGTELSIVDAVCGDCAYRNLKKHAFKALPGPENLLTPAESLEQMTNLTKEKFFSFLPRPAQGQILAMQKILNTIVEERQPILTDVLNQSNQFLCDCVARLQYFVKVADPKSTGSDSTLIFGTDALKVLLSNLQEAYEQGTATAQDCGPFVIFQHLMSKEMSKSADVVIADLLKGDDGACKRKRTEHQPAQAEATAAVSHAQAEATARAQSLFD